MIERQEHVIGIRQRRKAYSLTDAGRQTAARLQQGLRSAVVRVRDGDETHETTVSQALKVLGGDFSMSRFVTEVQARGTIDFESLRTQVQTPFVEILTNAPRIEGFTGRRDELRVISQESARHQLCVIQGIAGIGKSTLAAKACEFQRGKRNVFWHKVRSWDTDQTLFASFAEFLRALDRPALASVMKRGDAHRAAEILRQDVPGTRSLLVFDDAHEGGRGVMSFLSLLKDCIADAPDVQVLVLSRRRLAFYDARDVALSGVVRELTLGGLGASEVAALFMESNASPALLHASRRFHGHPLLCRLLLAAGLRPLPARIPREVHRFLEENVFAGLTSREGIAMRLLSLFVVPVPKTAVLSLPGTTAEAFDGLVSRFLVWPVGDECFEIHDTVREFILDAFPPRDWGKLRFHALRQLRHLAASARQRADFAACVGFLSNGLQLSRSRPELAELHEALGDAYGRLGDLAGALIAFRMSAKKTASRGALARVHRKAAEVLFAHGDFPASSKEIEASLRVIGVEDSADRGWLRLLQCRMFIEKEEFAEAIACGREARHIFTKFNLMHARAQSLLELGRIDVLDGRSDIIESGNLGSALELATRLGDPVLLANVHLAMADLATLRFSDARQAMGHFAAVEGIPTALADPAFACRFFWARGWTRIAVMNDREGAMRDCMESLRVAERLHDSASIAQARFGIATVHLICARLEAAEAEYGESAAMFQAQSLQRMEANARWLQAQCSLFNGDIVGFRRTLAIFDGLMTQTEAERTRPPAGPATIGPGVGLALHGFDHLLNGDRENALQCFREAVRRAEENDKLSILTSNVERPSVLVWYGMALRAIGDTDLGDELVSRGLDLHRTRHLEGPASLFGSEALAPFQQFLRQRWLDALRDRPAPQ